MPDAVTHPSPQELAAYGQGKLSPTATAAVARHLESCPRCLQLAAQAPADSFLGKVRAAGPTASGTRLPPPLPGQALPPAAALPAGLPPELANHAKFRIVRELGRGGMGVIYLAEHRVMDKRVALKVISPAVLDNPQALARFQAEVKAAGRLDHQNIARAYDADQAGDLHFLVMEFVEGQSLAQLLEKKGPLPIAAACHYVRQAAVGLQHACEREMVHRDIKPHNLMLTPKGVVKVLDFGLARLRSEHRAGSRLTQLESFMGTPEYVSPEQATDAREADIRADIYSLGCTLYALLAGRPPFVEETVVKVVLAHIEKAAAPLHELRPDVSAELSAVVAKMLAKDRAQRYQRPIEVAQALVPFIKAGSQMGVPSAVSATAGVALPSTGTRIGGDTSRVTGPGAGASKPPAEAAPAAAEAEKVSPFSDLGEPATPARVPKKTGRHASKLPPPGPPVWRRPAVRIGAGVALLVLATLGGLWAAGVFRVKTADGSVLIVEVNEPNPDVYVDGEKITVTWGGGGKRAEVRVRPGTRKVELKKDGVTLYGEEVEVEEGKRRLLTAKLTHPGPPPAPAVPERFVPLFNGQDLTGWHVIRGQAEEWQMEEGVITLTGGTGWNTRSILVSDREYTDYAVRFEFQADETGFAGFTVRSLPGRVVEDAPGGQVLIWGDRRAGRFQWVRGDGVAPRPAPQVQPAPNWNRMEVRLHGRRLRVVVNGTQVQNVDLDQIPDRPVVQPYLRRPRGTIEFTKLKGMVRLRNLQWCDLSNVPAPSDLAPPVKLVTAPQGGKADRLGNDGEWLREGDDLVQAALDPDVRLFFGDVEWTDYDFTCKAMRVAGPNGFDFLFRAADKYNWYIFTVGDWNNTKYSWQIVTEQRGTGFKESRDAGVNADQWYQVRVSVRGPRCQCFLDEQLIFDFSDNTHLRGAVGFRTWMTKVRFRDIKVTDPDGKVLWEGPPELDALETAK
jgi:serine/threonine protein kinase